MRAASFGVKVVGLDPTGEPQPIPQLSLLHAGLQTVNKVILIAAGAVSGPPTLGLGRGHMLMAIQSQPAQSTLATSVWGPR